MIWKGSGHSKSQKKTTGRFLFSSGTSNKQTITMRSRRQHNCLSVAELIILKTSIRFERIINEYLNDVFNTLRSSQSQSYLMIIG